MVDKNSYNEPIVQNIRPATPAMFKVLPIRVAKYLCDTFQTSTEKRTPPSPKKTQHIRLITIGASHYCEKVRWALDFLDDDDNSPFYYTEDAHPPLFHSFQTVPASSDKAISMTPMVVFNKGSERIVMCNSSDIVKYFCPFLYYGKASEFDAKLTNEIQEFESYLDQDLGATVRSLIYFHNFSNPNMYGNIIKLLCVSSSKIETFLFSKMLTAPNGVMHNIKKALKINEANAKISKERVKALFEKVSKQLEENLEEGENIEETFLFGSKYGFTAADLAFASLASPILLPKESLYDITEDKMPEELASLRRELLPTIAAQHALRIYQMHRFSLRGDSSARENAKVMIKTAKRNRFPLATVLTVAAGIVSLAYVRKSKL